MLLNLQDPFNSAHECNAAVKSAGKLEMPDSTSGRDIYEMRERVQQSLLARAAVFLCTQSAPQSHGQAGTLSDHPGRSDLSIGLRVLNIPFILQEGSRVSSQLSSWWRMATRT